MYEVRYVCLLQFVLSLVKFGRPCLFFSAALKILLSAPFHQNLPPFDKTQNSTLLAKIQKWRLPCQNAICTFLLLVKTPKSSPPCQITSEWVIQTSWNTHCTKFNISYMLSCIWYHFCYRSLPRLVQEYIGISWLQLGDRLVSACCSCCLLCLW